MKHFTKKSKTTVRYHKVTKSKNPERYDKVKRPANVFAYTFGSISAIIMGGGMSLIMTDIASKLGIGADPLIPGIVIGVVGMAMALVNYPIYKGILESRKKKYGPEILELSERIICNENK